MIEKLALLHPEMALFVGTCVVMLLGLSKAAAMRRLCVWATGLALAVAGALSLWSPEGDGQFPHLLAYFKAMTAGVGLLLLPLLTGVVDRGFEAAVARGERFDPIRATRGEFYAFLLFSLMGVMLCASADDLIWLFLALELTSLPTYIMVSISTGRMRSQEAGIKYFFLGAFGAAIFLYGFALLYGAAGTTNLQEIGAVIAERGLSGLALGGITLGVIGVSFKIAAVPMHFYTPDVYEGAASPVTAYLAFAPKAAGMVALLLLLGTVGWTQDGGLPDPLRAVVWVVAALTMTVGNTLAALQSNVKRMLAYSSVAHSGYMLVGLVAGPGDGSTWTNGLGAMLFYMLVYGATNGATFAVLACVERGRDGELETIDDLRGLCATRPVLGWSMAVAVLSLLGMPPLLGFVAKLLLFTSAIGAGEVALVVVLGLNSAAAAFYYLRIVSAVMFDRPTAASSEGEPTQYTGRIAAAALSAASALALLPVCAMLARSADHAGTPAGGVVAEAPDGGGATGRAMRDGE